jgi:hypothetical protein
MIKYALVLLLSVSTLTSASETLQRKCQRLVDEKIDLQDQRNKGGSGQYMNRLRKLIHINNKEYSKLGCYRIRTQLRFSKR